MCSLLIDSSEGPDSLPIYGAISSSNEADLARALAARASRSTSDFVRLDDLASVSRRENSDRENLTVTVGIGVAYYTVYEMQYESPLSPGTKENPRE